MATVLPTAATERLDEALAAFAEALGPEGVLTEAEDLLEWRDPYDFKSSDEYTGSAVLLPTSVEEVQAIVRIANEFGVPLWTSGQGRNYAYGGPAPRVKGSVLLNFRRMNRVLEVDDELAYAVVEPGVRFFDLHDHLQAGGHKLWPSIPDLGWGSVVGNTLEYGRGYTPYGNHPSTACGLEVVLPNGDLLRTGMGGMTNSKTWHAYQWSYGPSHQWLFFQSNFGIVTKMGVWLMRQPEVYLSGWARFLDDEGETTINEEGWALRFALYGREAIVEAQYAIVREALEVIPGVEVGRRLFRWDERAGAQNHNDKVQGGIPGMELMDAFKIPYGEDTGHLDLSPVGPLVGDDVVASIATMRELFERTEFPYLVGILFLERSLLQIATFFFDTKDERQTRAAYDTYAQMVVELKDRGYPIYRTNIQHMDLVADQFDFNDHAQRRLNELLKDTLDPNGILSPGKQGIWPRSMRPHA